MVAQDFENFLDQYIKAKNESSPNIVMWGVQTCVLSGKTRIQRLFFILTNGSLEKSQKQVLKQEI